MLATAIASPLSTPAIFCGIINHYLEAIAVLHFIPKYAYPST